MHCISLHCSGVVVYSSTLRLLQSIALFHALKKAREKLGLEINRRNKLSQRLKQSWKTFPETCGSPTNVSDWSIREITATAMGFLHAAV